MRPSTIAAALVIASLSLLSLGVLPILLGGLEQAGRITSAGIGQAAMLELFGLALGAAVGGYWMGRGNMRLKTAAAALGLAAVNIATAHAPEMTLVLMERAVAGLLAGLLFGAGNAIIVRSKDPDRLTGILCGASVVPSITLAYLLPVVVIPKFGIEAGFYALSAGALVALVFSVGLVDRVAKLEQPEHVPARLSWRLAIFAGALLLQSGGLGAAWTYIERLANQHGFSPSVIGLAIAGSLASQVAAAWLSAWVSPKVDKWQALLLLAVVQTGFIVLAILTGAPASFIAAVCLFGGAAAAMQAFQVAGVITLDTTRRTAVLVAPMILLGNGIGPLIASFFTAHGDVSGGAWTAVTMTSFAAFLYVAFALRSSRSLARPAYTGAHLPMSMPEGGSTDPLHIRGRH